MKCFTCGGAAHPASGSQYSESVVICGPCTREFWKWVRRHTSQKWGGSWFYELAVKFKKGRDDG